MIDPNLLTTTCDTRRPFGSPSILLADVPCRLVNDLPCGRGSGLAGVLAWTHYMDVQPGTDIIDGCSRPPGTDSELFTDGDQVNVPSGTVSPTWCVVWVATVNLGAPEEFLRVYLIRDTA